MSKSIYEILRFYIDPKAFVVGARTSVNNSQKQIIHNATERLHTIARSCISVEDKIPSPQTTELALRKFRKFHRHLDLTEFSSREIRALIYNMHEFRDSAMYESLALLLQKQWKNRFINGLLYYMLSNWDSADKNNLQIIINIFQEKISKYDGKRDKYLLLKKHAKYLMSNGPELLGMTLRKLDSDQTDSCSIWTAPSTYFGATSNKIDLEYYSKVITSYFERNALKRINLLKDILEEHNFNMTAKRIIPAMIVQNKDIIGEATQDSIRSIAVHLIGDSGISSYWTMKNGSPEEKRYLEDARTILNDWLKRKFISIFFEKCVHEPSRKKYWLDHVDMVSELKVWCTPLCLTLLNEDKKIADFITSNVRELEHEDSSNRAALIMTIANYTFVEFSDIGCLYLLLKNGSYGNRIATNQICYLDEIRRIRVDNIQDFMLNLKEGKIDHRPGWENILDKWMKIHKIT